MSAVASRPRWMRLFALLALLPVSSRAQRSRAVQVTASAAELTRVDHDTPAGAPIERPQVSPGQPLPVQWNALARELARRDRAVRSFQLFAELSGVQREALAAPGLAKWGDLAAAEASAQLLAAAFPARRAEIERLLAAQRQAARLTDQTDLVNLVKRLVAQARAVSRRRCAATLRDGSIDANGRWSSAPDGAPVGESIPRLCPQGGPLPRSPPPPRAATPAFRAALAEVQAAVRAATPEQRATLRDWAAAGGGEETPAIWNAVADRLLTRDKADAKRSAEVLAALNLAMREAAIACFTEKYSYLTMRPSQFDDTLRPGAPLPNFPSYPSAHACFSGAAAEALSRSFPQEKAKLDAIADEAAESRIWAGLHYRFDGEEGLRLGREACAHVLAH